MRRQAHELHQPPTGADALPEVCESSGSEGGEVGAKSDGARLSYSGLVVNVVLWHRCHWNATCAPQVAHVLCREKTFGAFSRLGHDARGCRCGPLKEGSNHSNTQCGAARFIIAPQPTLVGACERRRGVPP